jgi:hypothetical protein
VLSAVATIVLLQTQMVSLEVRGSRLDVIADELGKVFGEPVYFPPYMKNMALTIKVKDVPVGELRQKIAFVLNGNWQHESSGWRLSQSSEQKHDEEVYHKKEKLRLAEKAIARAKKNVEAMAPFTKKEAQSLDRDLTNLGNQKISDDWSQSQGFWKKVQETDSKGPIGRFASRMALRITPQMITEVESENPRIVYSTKPTQMQRAFPFKFGDLYQQFVDEQAVWASVANGKNYQGPEASGGGTYGLGDVAQYTTAVESRPSLFTISISGAENYFNAKLNAYDQKGKSLFNANFMSSYQEQENAFAEEGEMTEEQMKEKMKKLPPLSPEAEEFSKLLEYGGKKKSPSSTLFSKLIQPEKFDPTQYLLTERLWNHAGDRNFVAYLPSANSMWDFPTWNEKFLHQFFKVSKSENWLVLASKDPYRSRKQEFDRQLLGNISRYYARSRFLTLDDEANFIYMLPWAQESSFQYGQWLNVLDPDRQQFGYDTASYRIWATLPESVRKLAWEKRTDNSEDQKATLTFGELPEAAKLEIYRALFKDRNDDNYLQIDYQELTGPSGEWTAKVAEEQNELSNLVYGGGLLTEMTSTFGNGVPAQTPIKITVNQQQTLSADGEEGSKYQFVRTIDPDQLGQQMFQKEHPDKYPWVQQDYYNFDKNSLRIVHQINVTVSLGVRKAVTKQWSVGKARTLDPKRYSVDSLPETIREKVKKGYQSAKEQDKHYQSGGYSRPQRNTNIPPSF